MLKPPPAPAHLSETAYRWFQSFSPVQRLGKLSHGRVPTIHESSPAARDTCNPCKHAHKCSRVCERKIRSAAVATGAGAAGAGRSRIMRLPYAGAWIAECQGGWIVPATRLLPGSPNVAEAARLLQSRFCLYGCLSRCRCRCRCSDVASFTTTTRLVEYLAAKPCSQSFAAQTQAHARLAIFPIWVRPLSDAKIQIHRIMADIRF